MTTQIISTVTKTVSQNGQQMPTSSYTVAGVQAPPLETDVPVATPLVLVDGVGTLKHANLNLLYMLADALDCTVQFYTGADGSTGPIGAAIALVAGVPYEWDSNSGASPLGSSDAGSVKITATNFIKGVASGGTPVSTPVHMRTSLTA
ncbi:MAG: hypothetical protein ABSG68_11410 [Thermoguttaceae bacterium]|jgi:hypothetical protein